jgi:hypothetical protein
MAGAASHLDLFDFNLFPHQNAIRQDRPQSIISVLQIKSLLSISIHLAILASHENRIG